MNKLKNNIKIIIAFVMGIVISGTIAYAEIKTQASEVEYNNSTVKEALDYLYSGINKCEVDNNSIYLFNNNKMKCFNDLNSAIEEAGSEKSTITIIKNYTLTSIIRIEANQSIILNLNGNTITNTNDYYIENLGNLTVDDYSTSKGGKITGPNNAILASNSKTKQTIINYGYFYSSDDDAVILNGSGDLIVNGGHLASATSRGLKLTSSGTIYVNGNVPSSCNETSSVNYGEVCVFGTSNAAANDSTGSFIINGGNFSTSKYCAVWRSNGKLIVLNGTFTGPSGGISCDTAGKCYCSSTIYSNGTGNCSTTTLNS